MVPLQDYGIFKFVCVEKGAPSLRLKGVLSRLKQAFCNVLT